MRRYFCFLSALLMCLALRAIAAQQAAVGDSKAQGIEFFERKVRPILAAHCYECHSATHKKRGGLLLDSRAGFLKGGDSGPVVAPGKVEDSLLIKAVRHADPEPMMPKGRAKLTEELIADLEAWVKMGAPWPEDKGGSIALKTFDLKERAKHWSLQPIQSPSPPPVNNKSWSKSPIDQFILAKLEAAGLQPAGPADKRTLIRRVTFDLTGLPPAPEEIDTFLKDESPEAFARLVNRLLDSPRYGERWGRHWLDLVRYADTLGHEFDFDLPEAFRYRDYVIRALNADVPFDQFVMEHIAGDLLPTPRIHPQEKFNESILGTGFWFMGEAKHSPVDSRSDQADRLDNQIDVFSKTFLAMTVACARCHDHKFDAISTKDYYALSGYLQSAHFQRAFFDDTVLLREKIAKLKAIQREIIKLLDVNLEQITLADARGSGSSEWDGERVVFADFRGGSFKSWFISGEAFAYGPSGGILLQADQRQPIKSIIPPGMAHSGAVSEKLAGVLRSPTFTIDKKKIHYRVLGSKGKVRLILDGLQLIRDPIYGGLEFEVKSDALQWKTMDVSMWIGHRAYIELVDDGPGYLGIEQIVFCDLAMPKTKPADRQAIPEAGDALAPRLKELLEEYRAVEASLPTPKRAMAMQEGTPVEERVFIRGNHKTLGDIVPRRFLEVFGSEPNIISAPAVPARLSLAKRLVTPSNPLTARVIVNRLWKHHFGEGLVRSPDDFGVLGQTPTHPELLDWLATELMKNGWSLKQMHRCMLLTSTYQMSSQAEPAADQADADNKLLHKMPIRRLEAEAIRDAMLAVSGRLDTTMFGPGVQPHLTPFMSGRGRPNSSGPLDGNGRRSVYLAVRRNFLTPMLLAFDYPVPFSTIGKRSVSNVPAQALTLLNNPFVLQQAEVWAKQVLSDKEISAAERVQRMYESAFARPPSAQELNEALAFVEEQGRQYGSTNDLRLWTDVAHVLFNVKEFVFVN
jgi:hypothetical protein